MISSKVRWTILILVQIIITSGWATIALYAVKLNVYWRTFGYEGSDGVNGSFTVPWLRNGVEDEYFSPEKNLFLVAFPGVMAATHVVCIFWLLRNVCFGCFMNTVPKPAPKEKTIHVGYLDNSQILHITKFTYTSYMLCGLYISAVAFSNDGERAYLPRSDVLTGFISLQFMAPMAFGQIGCSNHTIWLMYVLSIRLLRVRLSHSLIHSLTHSLSLSLTYSYRMSLVSWALYLRGVRKYFSVAGIIATFMAFTLCVILEHFRDLELNSMYDKWHSYSQGLGLGAPEDGKFKGGSHEIAYTMNTIHNSIKRLTAELKSYGVIEIQMEQCEQQRGRNGEGVVGNAAAVSGEDDKSNSESESTNNNTQNGNKSSNSSKSKSESDNNKNKSNTVHESENKNEEKEENSSAVDDEGNEGNEVKTSQIIFGYRWNKTAAHVSESRLICIAMILVTGKMRDATSDNYGALTETNFPFGLMCLRIFTMVEASRGRLLPLYTGDGTSEVSILAKKGLLEIILLLLLYDVIPIISKRSDSSRRAKNKSTTNATTSNTNDSAGAGTEKSRPGSANNSTKLGNSDGTPNHNNYNSKYKRKKTLREKDVISCVRCNIVEGSWTMTVSTTRAYNPKDSLQHQTGVSASGEGRSLFKLASHLAEMYMGGPIEEGEFADPINKVLVTHRSVRITGRARNASGVVVKSRVLSGHPSWLIVDCHTSARDFRDYQMFIVLLKTLGIPFMTCSSMKELHYWKLQHSIVVISDITLNSRHLHLLLDLKKVTARNLVVISDTKSTDFYKTRYDIDVARTVAITAKSILECNAALLKQQPATLVNDKNLCSFNIGKNNEYERGRE